ncbi:hypothetical protein TI04_12070 [Achromatium sp. WMS2]|nr:hypothetical protein TI04_12070 [Achromatium sp. WMS2]
MIRNIGKVTRELAKRAPGYKTRSAKIAAISRKQSLGNGSSNSEIDPDFATEEGMERLSAFLHSQGL